jgi:diguanylate cyclase (GGDEF)-like protein
LRKLVFLDGMTGVFNRRYFDQQISTEWSRAARNNTPLSLILLDVDFFKLFNDTYGHQAGDDALRVVATSLKSCLRRPADLVARYGGEEFACVLPETSYEDALAIADELERNVRALAIAHQNSEAAPVITISLGLATRIENSHSDVQDLIGLADRQLYEAKHSGRARVCSAVLTPGTPSMRG